VGRGRCRGSRGGENLYERAQEIGRLKGFEVIQVIGKRMAAVLGLTDSGESDASGIPDLLQSRPRSSPPAGERAWTQ